MANVVTVTILVLATILMHSMPIYFAREHDQLILYICSFCDPSLV